MSFVRYANQEVREAAQKNGVRLWEVAERLGVSETTFSKSLRHELPQPKKQHLLDLIAEIAEAQNRSAEELF